jgi:hypothetical protein
MNRYHVVFLLVCFTWNISASTALNNPYICCRKIDFDSRVNSFCFLDSDDPLALVSTSSHQYITCINSQRIKSLKIPAKLNARQLRDTFLIKYGYMVINEKELDDRWKIHFCIENEDAEIVPMHNILSCKPMLAHHISTLKEPKHELHALRLSDQCTLILCDANTGRDICSLKHENPIIDCCLHSLPLRIASITKTAQESIIHLRFFNFPRSIFNMDIPWNNDITSVRFNETGTRLVITCQNSIVLFSTPNPRKKDPEIFYESIKNDIHATEAYFNRENLILIGANNTKIINLLAKEKSASLPAANNTVSFHHPRGLVAIPYNKQVLLYQKES